MKASELIAELTKAIFEVGDLPVKVTRAYSDAFDEAQGILILPDDPKKHAESIAIE